MAFTSWVFLSVCWQLCAEVASLGSELNLAQVEGQKNEAALEEAGRGRAELARDKAALVVQLTASERENSALSEELAAFRSQLIRYHVKKPRSCSFTSSTEIDL